MSNQLIRLSTALGLSFALAGCATTDGANTNTTGASFATPILSTPRGPVGASSETGPDCVVGSTVNLVIIKIGTRTFSDRCAAYKAATEMVASGDPALMILGTTALAELNPTIRGQVSNYANQYGTQTPTKQTVDCDVVGISERNGVRTAQFDCT